MTKYVGGPGHHALGGCLIDRANALRIRTQCRESQAKTQGTKLHKMTFP